MMTLSSVKSKNSTTNSNKERKEPKICIAVAKQAGIAISEEILKNCYDNNPDGAGFAVENEDGSFTIEKGFFSFKSFYDAFQPHEHKKALIHFRIKTHGPINKENCHPFSVNNDLVFIHNGIIHDVPNHRTQSDTRIFNKLYLKPITKALGNEVIHSKIFSKLIEKFIGGSKLAFMKKGEKGFTILNKHKGNYSKEGIWFSNMSWQTSRPTYSGYSNYSRTPANNNDFSSPAWKLPAPANDTSGRKEINLLKSASGETFSFGSAVRLRWVYNGSNFTIEKGAIGEVERVYDDNTADVEFYFTDQKVNIKVYQLEELQTFPADFWGA